jgi:hypothetical protein
MPIQPRLRSASTSSLRPVRALRRRIGRLTAFLLRNPVLPSVAFIVGVVVCLSVLLTSDRAPSTALPAPPSDGCAMFCTDQAPEPGSDVTSTTAADQRAGETRPCWMFCKNSTSLATAAIGDDGAPSAVAPWQLDQ